MQAKALPILLLFILSFMVLLPVARAQVEGPAPYVSEHQKLCIEEMKEDAVILAECESQWTTNLREQDYRQVTQDNKHVVMAYAAIWIITMIFVTGLWIRQRKLSAEIDRLEEELKKAVAE